MSRLIKSWMHVIIPDGWMFSWESQACQYPRSMPKGIHHMRGDPDVDMGAAAYCLPATDPRCKPNWIDCVLLYDRHSKLRGILNHYCADSAWEEAGNFNLWVDPDHQGKGIGTRLLHWMDKQWDINYRRQRYTPSGAALVTKFLNSQQKEQPTVLNGCSPFDDDFIRERLKKADAEIQSVTIRPASGNFKKGTPLLIEFESGSIPTDEELEEADDQKWSDIKESQR